MNKRLAAMRKDKKPSVNSNHRQPGVPSGEVSQADEAGINASLRLTQLKKEVSKLDIDLTTYLVNEAGIAVDSPARTLRFPNGETHTFVSSHLNVDQLEKCVIDDDNVRDESERTEQALSDIIDDIGEGYQLTPVVAYVNDTGDIVIVDGSRRMASAILRNIGLDFDIFKDKPSPDVIRWYVEASDKKKKFSEHDTGRLYHQIMQRNDWTLKQLAEAKKVDEGLASTRVNMYRAPDALKSLLASRDTTQAEAKQFVAAVNTLKAMKRVDEAVERVTHEIAGEEFESAKAHNKAVIALLNVVAKREEKKAAKKKAEPQKLYTAGKSSVVYQPGDRNSTLKLARLPSELEKEIVELIKERLEKVQ